MTRRVVAFFACSFLSVSATYPAAAVETGGTIEAIDRDEASLTLSDGATYRLPDAFDYAVVRPGMEVVVVYDAAPL
ncbi:DUF1344 domain-containing protein [Aureimonas flava]|uniref:DUF1344 domain-containing protein n=1 Tax=Aureimonas flava TaxID=2320271 RepID=A0A3A1WRS6_9HYPH|nr:DUF1344 domain-containing protein [Aureimonas flava]RIY03385.1 DUF1344 domain-containing protein [Aureimonas flava]